MLAFSYLLFWRPVSLRRLGPDTACMAPGHAACAPQNTVQPATTVYPSTAAPSVSRPRPTIAIHPSRRRQRRTLLKPIPRRHINPIHRRPSIATRRSRRQRPCISPINRARNTNILGRTTGRRCGGRRRASRLGPSMPAPPSPADGTTWPRCGPVRRSTGPASPGMMNQMLAEQGCNGWGGDGCGYAAPMNRFDQAACGPYPGGCGIMALAAKATAALVRLRFGVGDGP